MNRFAWITVASLIAALTLGLAAHAEVRSLRGDRPIDAGAQMFDKKRPKTLEGGFKRAWKTAPPAIPHSIDKDRITLEDNSCMRCHSAENFKKEKAPKVGDSHFLAADGTKLKDISARRYFCNQCHVPQMDAKPLVENTFSAK